MGGNESPQHLTNEAALSRPAIPHNARRRASYLAFHAPQEDDKTSFASSSSSSSHHNTFKDKKSYNNKCIFLLFVILILFILLLLLVILLQTEVIPWVFLDAVLYDYI